MLYQHRFGSSVWSENPEKILCRANRELDILSYCFSCEPEVY